MSGANLGDSSAGKKGTCPHVLWADVWGSRGSSVVVRAELNGQLELLGVVLAWISHCLHNYRTTDNRKGANSLFKGT